jgi:predicted PurR-regulated permease PerM
MCLSLISMLVSTALKVTFQIPLSPSLGKPGFAFPSGHMQLSVVLYGWLITNTRNIVHKILLIALLIGIGFSLIYFGYHSYFDIFGAVFFGSLLVFFYTLLTKYEKRLLSLILLIFSTFSMIYIASLYEISVHAREAYIALIGVLFFDKIFAKKIKFLTFRSKILGTVAFFAMLLIIKNLSLPVFIAQIQQAIISFIKSMVSVISHITPAKFISSACFIEGATFLCLVLLFIGIVGVFLHYIDCCKDRSKYQGLKKIEELSPKVGPQVLPSGHDLSIKPSMIISFVSAGTNLTNKVLEKIKRISLVIF